MDSVLFSLILFALLSSGLAAEECDVKKVDSFLKCTESKIEKEMPRWTPDLIKEIHDQVDKCFTSNDCEKPEYERDIFADLPPNMQTLARKIKSDWIDTPKEVKDCIMEEMKDGIKAEVNQCLLAHNVAAIEEVPEQLVKHVKEMLGGNENKVQQKLLESLFTAKTNTARAIRKCGESKGDGAENKVWSCFQDVRQKYLFIQMCEDKKSCANETLDDVCIKRGKEIENATCQCREEKREILLDKLDEMKNKTFDIDAMISIMAKEHNVSELVGKVKECYEKNKAPLPTVLKFAEAIRKGKDTGKVPKIQLNSNTVNTIYDIINALMDDETCYVCQGQTDSDASHSSFFESSNSTSTETGAAAISENKNSTHIAADNSTSTE